MVVRTCLYEKKKKKLKIIIVIVNNVNWIQNVLSNECFNNYCIF